MPRPATKPTKTVHSPSQRVFCELMIGARKRMGLTQKALADRLRRPQSFVAKYEGGERRIDVLEFTQICGAIGVDPARLLRQLKAGQGAGT